MLTKCVDHSFDFGVIANRRCNRLNAEQLGSSLERGQVIRFDIRGRVRVEQGSDPFDARRNLREQLQPLAGR